MVYNTISLLLPFPSLLSTRLHSNLYFNLRLASRNSNREEMKLAVLLAAYAVNTSAFSPTTTNHLQLSSSSSRFSAAASPTSLSAMPICIIVEAEIKEDRMDEFLDMIEKNAIGSRAEPGCIRFGKSS